MMMQATGQDQAPPEPEATLHDHLVLQLRNLLLEDEFAAGSRIPEAELCERFGVSRTPLREALKVMAAEGLVTLRPNRGAVVSPIDPSQIGPIIELKGALEGLIGTLAAQRIDAATMAKLEAHHLALGDALSRRDHGAYTRLNYAFHQLMAQASGNPLLAQSYESLQQKIWRFRFAVNEFDGRLARSYQEHEDIMVALRARTRLDLAERLQEHNRQTGEAMMRAFDKIAEGKPRSKKGSSA